MRLADPIYLLGLLVVLGAFLWDRRRRHSRPRLAYSHVALFDQGGWRSNLDRMVPWLFVLGGVALVLALARPQTGATRIEIKSEGIDIVLAIDISGSMRAEDIKPNRLAAAKEVAGRFLAGRQGDRVGLVVFAGGAYTQCPLTLDYSILASLLGQVDFGQVPDGTAIGMALATAVNRLRESQGESRVVILLTDGQNNAGDIDPITAAEAARALGVRVYTIGAGTQGPARVPVDDPVFGKRYVTIDAQVDEETLRRIAEITGGKSFRATSGDALRAIYDEIDRMERTEAETVEYVRYTELGPLLSLLAALALGAGILVGFTAGSRIP